MPVNSPPPPAQLPSPSPLPAVALLLLVLCWALLCLVHLRRVGEGGLYDPKRAAAAIRTQYEQLGPPSYPEVAPPVGSGLSVAAQLEGRAPMQRPQGTEPPGAGLLHAPLYALDCSTHLERGAAEPCQPPSLGCAAHRQRTPTLGPPTHSPPSRVAVLGRVHPRPGGGGSRLRDARSALDLAGPEGPPRLGRRLHARPRDRRHRSGAARPGHHVGRSWPQRLRLLGGGGRGLGALRLGAARHGLPRPRVLGAAAPKPARSTGSGCGLTVSK